MRIIKVKKSSGLAKDAGLDDAFSIEVGELEAGKTRPAYRKGRRQAKAQEKTGALKSQQGRHTQLQTSDDDQAFDLFADSVEITKKRSRRPNKDRALESEGKSSVDDVYNRGIYLLSMREHSVKELSDKLRQKFPASSEIEIVVQRLLENGYVSDNRFAEAYVRQRGAKGLGPIKIRAELHKKGIKNSLIEEFIDVDSYQWIESAIRQYKKKFGDSKVEDYKDWARRARFLQSRGYSSKHIELAIPEINH